MFIDRTIINVFAGHGGSGCASFHRAKFLPKGGPDGGDGGKGGNVIITASHSESSLIALRFQPNWKAERGVDGSGRQMTGRNGADCRITVPIGTLIFDADTDELLADLTQEGQEVVVARGGKGGKGNLHFVSSTNRAPREFTPGLDGEERRLELELKMIADIGLVGFPNAGKSTVLSQVSKAHPKVAAYPFTTLNANVGVVDFPDFTRITIADIPGLIEGAHDNVGLGEAFLRHIERCRMFCYVLDMGGVDGRDPVDDLRILRDELEAYEPGMSKWPFVILANKMDVPEAEENLRRLRESEGPNVDILCACAELGEGLPELLELLRKRLKELPPVDEEALRRVLSKHHRALKTTAEIRGNAFEDWE